MKKFFSLLLVFLFFTGLLDPCSAASSTGFSREPFLSSSFYSPSQENCLYIYVPVYGNGLRCQVSVYDELNVLVYQDSRDGLSTNVQTFFWNAQPAAGNAAAYDASSYVQPGNYTVVIQLTGSGLYEERSLPVWITQPGEYLADDENGIPNLTGNAQCDYLAEMILEEIGIAGLSNAEKYYAIYTWVQQNCYRENANYSRPKNESNYFYDINTFTDEIAQYQFLCNVQHEQGLLNYDVHGDLETKLALKMMLERVGTCYEFSSLLQILLEHTGIECHVYGGYFHNSDGSSVIHKWNFLRLNGIYYWSDVRIDNASYERSGRTTLYYDYFLEKSTSVWKNRHSWDEDAYPQYSTRTPAFDAFASAGTGQLSAPGRESADYPLSSFIDLYERTAITTNAMLTIIGGSSYLLEAYNIDGYNYLKLRDIAYILSGSQTQFDVGWSEEENRITLTAGQAYTSTGSELVRQSLHNPIAAPSTSEILFNTKPTALCAYFIHGNNYFRLRDLAILFNFAVGWDEAENAILVNPLYEYSE